MSAIALALFKKGYSISGSDLINNKQINELKKLGVLIFKNQLENNISFIVSKFKNETLNIVISSAIKTDNAELKYCLKNNFPIRHRSEILALIMNSYYSLAISGSHGKTSTSTFLSTILDLCTKNCSSIIGGIVPIYKSNSHIDNTKYLVAEIDESDGTTYHYKPDIGIINNIDFDHCDYYSNINELLLAFKAFASNSKKILINYDCKITRKNFDSRYRWSNKEFKNITYSLIPKIINKYNTIGNYYENGNLIETLNIPIPGLHNLSNITAAIGASRMLGINIKRIKNNLKFLKLPNKRFEFRGEFNQRKIYDDYAHHPSEIKATIELARLFIEDNTHADKENRSRLIVIFQPHRYTRVEQFANEFAKELAKADLILITKIFGAGEQNKNNINSKLIAKIIYKRNKNIECLEDNYEIKRKFHKLTKKNDLILNMGAGDCHNLWSILNNSNIEN